MTKPGTPSADELAAERTDLAETRTLMAADRTLMAWVRTSLSLLSFSFTIYQVLEQLPRFTNGGEGNASARTVGLILAAMGTFAMVMGTADYWYTLKVLRQLKHFSLGRPALIMALLMSIMGVTLLLSISTRWF